MRVYKVEYRGRDKQLHVAQKWYLEFRDHRQTNRRLAGFTSKSAPAAPLFRLPHPDTMVDMLRVDLDAADIAYEQDGKFADMHALRHTCGTWLAAAGVHPKVMQRILRHSTIALTLDRYTHAFKSDEAAAIAKLPSLATTPVGPALRATGTEGP